MNQQKCTEAWQVAAQQIAGADLAIEDPFEAVLAFAALQVKFGDTVPAARRLSSTVSRPSSKRGRRKTHE